MSSIYSQSGRNTPEGEPLGRPVERRIYSLSTENSTETINTASVLPTLNPLVPRVRILLAPYMVDLLASLWHLNTSNLLAVTLCRADTQSQDLGCEQPIIPIDNRAVS